MTGQRLNVWRRIGLRKAKARPGWTGRERTRQAPHARFHQRAAEKLWKFVNSAFFLFLMSTVAVTWGTKLYTDYQARERLRGEQRAQAVRIVSEISLRSIRLSSLEFRRQRLLAAAMERVTPEELARIREERAAHLEAARAIIRGGGEQGAAARDFSDTHLGILLRQNDLLTGFNSAPLALLATWVESEGFPLRVITPDLERYVAVQELGLNAGLLPLLPGDDAAREQFDEIVRRRASAVPAQIQALFKQNHELQAEDAELEGAVGARELVDSIGDAIRGGEQ